ncbi:sigma-54-dependent Fis family transcriptional regulator [bacterium]|nr:sigma-54-dependent Fis family transcriptional regulator [bacterium]
MSKVLIVDDQQSILDVLSIMLKREGFEVFTALSGEEALRVVRNDNIDLTIADIKMMPMDGIALLEGIKKIDSEIAVIMMTAYASIQTAIDAMKKGAFEYIIKPFKMDELRLLIQRGLKQRSIIQENRSLKQQIQQKYTFDQLIGSSKQMQDLFSIIRKVAPTDSTILVYGESGTGKELVARAIHYNSKRRDKAFEPINCAALPESLLESELFGHVRGAFTGAYADKQGLFVVADKGSIFLDEIGGMSTAMQSKLLRVLQEKEIKRVGDTKQRKIDVRVIAATNEDLAEKVKKGTFREDLYYRLSVIPVELAPLREKREDIPLLVRHFLDRQNKKAGRERKINPEAMDVLTSYDWPGNIRELENVIERGSTLCEGDVIVAEDLPPRLLNGADSRRRGDYTLKNILKDSERRHIRNVLRKTDGDKKKAAEILAISVPSLYRKLDQLDIRDF